MSTNVIGPEVLNRSHPCEPITPILSVIGVCHQPLLSQIINGAESDPVLSAPRMPLVCVVSVTVGKNRLIAQIGVSKR